MKTPGNGNPLSFNGNPLPFMEIIFWKTRHVWVKWTLFLLFNLLQSLLKSLLISAKIKIRGNFEEKILMNRSGVHFVVTANKFRAFLKGSVVLHPTLTDGRIFSDFGLLFYEKVTYAIHWNFEVDFWVWHKPRTHLICRCLNFSKNIMRNYFWVFIFKNILQINKIYRKLRLKDRIKKN